MTPWLHAKILRYLKMVLLSLLSLGSQGCGSQDPYVVHTTSYDISNPHRLMDVYRPREAVGRVPTVVFVHGGAWSMGSRRDGKKYADVLCGKGLQVISVDYRLTSSGAVWPEPLDDVRAAVKFLRQNADPFGIESLALMGSSAGACTASLAYLIGDSEDDANLGMRPVCLVDISGEGDVRRLPPSRCFASFDEVLGRLFGHPAPFSVDELSSISPAAYARGGTKVLIAHSTHDSNVFVDQSDAFAGALSGCGSGVVYLREEGYAHGDDLWEQDGVVRWEVATFLLNNLRGR